MKVKKEKSPTSLLYELAGKRKIKVEFRHQTEVYGEDKPVFICKAVLDDQEVGQGSGPSKKRAQHEASLQAISHLAASPESKELLRELYYGSETAPPDPVSALHNLAQSRKAAIRYETAVVCRTYLGGDLVATAEGEKPSVAKKESCLQAIAYLMRHSDSPQTAVSVPDVCAQSDQRSSEVYLLQLTRELSLSPQAAHTLDSISTVITNVGEDCKRIGVDFILKIGAFAAGCLCKDSEVDFAVVSSSGSLDLRCFAEKFAVLLADRMRGPTSRAKKQKIAESSDAYESLHCEFTAEDSFSMTISAIKFRFSLVDRKSPALSHSRWVALQPATSVQTSTLQLLRHWKRTSPSKRAVPTELFDLLVLVHCCTVPTAGCCFRKAMELLSGGVFLPETAGSDYLQPFHRAILENWSLAERVAAMGEAFVTLVQIAKDEVSALM